MMRRRIFALALTLTTAPAAQAAPPPLEDLALLDVRVAVHLGGTPADAGLIAHPVDRRLRLLHCPEGPQFGPPSGGAVDAACPSKRWQLRIPLRKGGSAQTEIVVRRGDVVELSFTGSGFSVTTSATATEDGSLGSIVRVKPPTGSTMLSARVRGPGAVAAGDPIR